MSYKKKKVPHIKGNEAKPYIAQLIMENQAKTQHDATPSHPRKGANKNLPKQASSYNAVPRQSWRSPLQAWVETHSSSTIALSTPSHTPIIVDLPATTSKQNQILTLQTSQVLKLVGASPHPPPHNTEVTTLKRHTATGHCFAKIR